MLVARAVHDAITDRQWLCTCCISVPSACLDGLDLCMVHRHVAQLRILHCAQLLKRTPQHVWDVVELFLGEYLVLCVVFKPSTGCGFCCATQCMEDSVPGCTLTLCCIPCYLKLPDKGCRFYQGYAEGRLMSGSVWLALHVAA